MNRLWRRRGAVSAALIVSWLLAAPVQAQSSSSRLPRSNKPSGTPWPLTRPERTAFAETSRYDEVIAFMHDMASRTPAIHLTTYGYTFEGRPLPLAVIGAKSATAADVLASGKTRIYIQGNIHAGEVEGKEAMLWLLRAIAKGEHADWFRHVVLLINPIFNADGNERVNLKNRGAQHGPIGGMGQRHNAQDLDLNRDNTKLETSEARSMAALMTAYDPHVAIDLHTTNGSNHGYYLTYDTSGSPNTATGIAQLVRQQLLPAVTTAVKQQHGWDLFYYGGVYGQGERAWRGDLDLYKPRYTQTYWGLRNRIGILSETYSYATFEDRIKATYWFVEEIVNFVSARAADVRKAVADADAESIIGRPQAVRNRLVASPTPVNIVIADVVEERNPYVPDRPIRRRVNGSERIEVLPHVGVIEPVDTAVAPRAYILPAPSAATSATPSAQPGTPGPQGMPGGPGAPPAMRPPQVSPGVRVMATVIDRLEAHGVRYYKTTRNESVATDRFRIGSTAVAQTEYQGTHKPRTMTGSWESNAGVVPAGSLVIPLDQPLARLVFALCDPMSDDGFMTWNILDPLLTTTPAPEFYPLLRTMETLAR